MRATSELQQLYEAERTRSATCASDPASASKATPPPPPPGPEPSAIAAAAATGTADGAGLVAAIERVLKESLSEHQRQLSDALVQSQQQHRQAHALEILDPSPRREASPSPQVQVQAHAQAASQDGPLSSETRRRERSVAPLEDELELSAAWSPASRTPGSGSARAAPSPALVADSEARLGGDWV